MVLHQAISLPLSTYNTIFYQAVFWLANQKSPRTDRYQTEIDPQPAILLGTSCSHHSTEDYRSAVQWVWLVCQ